MISSGTLTALSVVVSLGAAVAYFSLLRVPVVRNHPEGYVVAFALATALAGLAVIRATGRRWPAWLALGLSSLMLLAGAWFNFVLSRVPVFPPAIRVGEAPPDFMLPDALGRSVSLAEYRGKKPVVLVFYRGYW